MVHEDLSQSDSGLKKALKELQVLGLDVLTSDQELQAFSRDAGLYQGNPRAVVRFSKDLLNATDEQQRDLIFKQILAIAHQHHVVLTFVGSRTSVAGQAVNQNGIIVDMSTFDRPGAEKYVETEPGVVLDDLNVYARGRMSREVYTPGYEHSLDLSSSYMATIGGTIMNNGGGILATKYGSARDNVVDLRIALPDGRIMWTSEIQEQGKYSDIYQELKRLIRTVGWEPIQKAQPNVKKNASGYNLRALAEQEEKNKPLDITQIFIGSEGTLGTLLRAKVKVQPIAVPKVTVLVFFDSLDKMALAVADILNITIDERHIKPRALEVISGSIFNIISELGDLGNLGKELPKECTPPNYANAAALLIEYDDAIEVAHTALEKLRTLCERYIPVRANSMIDCFREVKDENQRDNFWFLRKNTVQILNQYGRKHDLIAPPLIEDIGVPIEHLGMIITFLQKEINDAEMRSAIFGHAGDGNLHVRPLLGRNQDQRERAWYLMDSVYRKVTGIGGTISAEHGDGRLRTPYLEMLYGTEMTALFKHIKELFDPHYILNPGVKVPHPDWPNDQFRDWDILGFRPTGGGKAPNPGNSPPQGGEDVVS